MSKWAMGDENLEAERSMRLREDRDRALAKAAAWHPLSRRAARFGWLFMKTRRAAKALKGSGLFDEAHYRNQLPEDFDPGDPAVHYLLAGWKLGLSPNLLFDAKFFASRRECEGKCPLLVFLEHGTDDPHPHFDSAYYLAEYPDVSKSQLYASDHYLKHGAGEMRSPNPMFDPAFYTKQLVVDSEAPLIHYLRVGRWRRISPHPLFDPDYYESSLKTPPLDEDLLTDYLRRGQAAGEKPHPLFDPGYYLAQVPDAQYPVAHFLRHGRRLNVSPCPLFDPVAYRNDNEGVMGGEANGLLHFMAGGWRSGARPHRLFDTTFYIKRYPDSTKDGDPLSFYYKTGAARGDKPNILFDSAYYAAHPGVGDQNPLEHYVTTGWKKGFRPNPYFDPSYYLEIHPDIRESNAEPLAHYLDIGWTENRNPSPEFDTAYYAQRGGDFMKIGLNPLGHFLEYGIKEGRKSRREPEPEIKPAKVALDTNFRLPPDSPHRLIEEGNAREFGVLLQAAREHVQYLELMAQTHFHD